MNLRKRLLEKPWVYENLMKIFRGKASLEFVADKLINPVDGERILDLGCSTATILSVMPNVEYTGIDNNPNYI